MAWDPRVVSLFVPQGKDLHLLPGTYRAIRVRELDAQARLAQFDQALFGQQAGAVPADELWRFVRKRVKS
jgi:hypothetical protein